MARTKWVYDFEEGDTSQKALLGGKGANLAEMTNLELPVPPGFTITTEACNAYRTEGGFPDGFLDEEFAIHDWYAPVTATIELLTFLKAVAKVTQGLTERNLRLRFQAVGRSERMMVRKHPWFEPFFRERVAWLRDAPTISRVWAWAGQVASRHLAPPRLDAGVLNLYAALGESLLPVLEAVVSWDPGPRLNPLIAAKYWSWRSSSWSGMWPSSRAW